ncbi:MAG: hypothetical protein FJ255_11220 [Phycisphaerae bacterium]|nr:hypothetical protein [Phycisphaerae bacterium]
MRAAALIVAVGVACPASADWPTDPSANLPIAVGSADQVVVKLAAAPDGSTYIGWFDNRGGAYAVYLQRLDPSGTPAWSATGLLVSGHPQNSSLVDWDLIADSAGSAVLAFTDVRDGGDLDVFAYRVSPAGQPQWGPDGVQISANANFDADPRLARNTDGDVVVVYPRLGTPDPGLMMQIVSPAGVKRFAGDGVRVGGDGVEAPAFNEVVPADNGSVIVSFVRDTRTFPSPRHVRAQKVSSAGALLWNAGAPVIVSTTSVPIAHRPRLAADGAGGAILAWHDTRTGIFQVWTQRLDAGGGALWTAGGHAASTDVSVQQLDPALAYRAASQEAFVFWNTRNGGQSQWGQGAQKIAGGGGRAWTDPGISLAPLSTTNRSFERAVPLDDGVVLLWLQTPQGSNQDQLLARRLDASGADVWSPAVRVVSSRASDKFRLAVGVGPDSVIRVAWEEGGDVYAQNLNPDGSIGPRCRGDWNGDGTIDFNDFLDFLNDFNAGAPRADLNADGVVDFNDLLEFLNLYNTPC